MRTKDTIAKLAERNDRAQDALRRHIASYGGSGRLRCLRSC